MGRNNRYMCLFSGCFKPKETPSVLPEPTKKVVMKQASFQRLSFSDLSNSSMALSPEDLSLSFIGSNLLLFTLTEMKVATRNFSSSNFLGEGGFGPVHKGFLDEKVRPGLKSQPVAVKLLDLDGGQGHREWLAEVCFLGQLRHQNLVKLIGYSYAEEHRLLVYEYMPRGSLEKHLFNRFSTALPWLARLKIAVGAAKGLAFLHEVEKPVIYRDFKASNILLDSDYTAKLSDFGLAKDGPEGDDTHVSTRVMGTHGYAAPEYVMTGHLTAKSDVYSFGVVLLELLTGRRSVDKTRPPREQNLVDWARSCLTDPKKLNRIIDPRLEGQYSAQGAHKAAQMAYQCLRKSPKLRPIMRTVVETLEPLLALVQDVPVSHFVYTVDAGQEPKKSISNESENRRSEDDLNGRCSQSSVKSPKHSGRVSITEPEEEAHMRKSGSEENKIRRNPHYYRQSRLNGHRVFPPRSSEGITRFSFSEAKGRKKEDRET